MEQTPAQLAELARQYITRGKNGQVDDVTLATACEALIRDVSQRSLSEAFRLGHRFHRRTRSQPQFRLAACRAMARVCHLSARYVEAEKYYRQISRLVTGDKLTTARVHRALSDVYMYLNRFERARQAARTAIATFKKLGMHGDVAMAEVNYANLLHRQDRHREAEKIYAKAAAYFEQQGDLVSTAPCLYNRANTLVQLFDFDTAEQLYTRAEEIYACKEMQLEATDARYGLAWLRMLRGEFHVALIDLASCEQTYRAVGQPKGVALCDLDRAEVYLGLNLFEDAWDSARRAEAQFLGLGLRYEASKAALFRARASYMLGNRRQLKSALAKARAGFEKEQNSGFLGAAALLSAEIARDRRVARREIIKARKLFSRAQLPLWEGACDLFAAAFTDTSKAALQRLEANRAVQIVPHLYARWQTLLGDTCAESGSLSLARLHWTRAADRLDTVRAQLPPVEFRATFGQDVTGPHKRLIQAELPDRPRHAAAWSERYKTSGLWSTPLTQEHDDPVRRKAEQSLIELANQAAHVWGKSASKSGKRGTTQQAADAAVRKMQRQVRLALAATEQGKDTAFDSIPNLLELLEKVSSRVPVLQFHVGDDEIVAFIHEGNQTRVHRYVDGPSKLADLMLQWRFIMESQSLAQRLGESFDLEAENRLFEQFGSWLWSPLEVASDHNRLLIIPEGALANLPWAAIRIDRQPLLLRHRFIISPSLRHHNRACQQHAADGPVELFAGTGDDLPEVKLELEQLARLAGGSVSIHSPAIRDSWPMRGSARIWHYAGHARLRSDNPFYSFLAMQDGPLFAADFRLRRVAVELVTLAACRTGEQVASPGEEASGLVRSLLEMGARNVIAGSWPVADDSTALWMRSFYADFFTTGDLLESTAKASMAVQERYQSAYHWAAFAVFGAGK